MRCLKKDFIFKDILGVFFLAFVIRFVVAVFTKGLFFPEEWEYEKIAVNLYTGNGFLINFIGKTTQTLVITETIKKISHPARLTFLANASTLLFPVQEKIRKALKSNPVNLLDPVKKAAVKITIKQETYISLFFLSLALRERKTPKIKAIWR